VFGSRKFHYNNKIQKNWDKQFKEISTTPKEWNKQPSKKSQKDLYTRWMDKEKQPELLWL